MCWYKVVFIGERKGSNIYPKDMWKGVRNGSHVMQKAVHLTAMKGLFYGRRNISYHMSVPATEQKHDGEQRLIKGKRQRNSQTILFS